METMRGPVRDLSPELSHGERDACLHALGALHAAGKLTLSELDSRIKAALAARTSDELAVLVEDSTPVQDEPQRLVEHGARPAGIHRSRRTSGAVFAARWILFAALTLPVAIVKLLVLAAVAVGVCVARVGRAAAHRGRSAAQTLARHAGPRGVAGGQSPVSQDLVLSPRPQVPAQREPVKIHPVLVPTEVPVFSTDLVLAKRTTDVVLVDRAVFARSGSAQELTPVGRTSLRQERRVRELVSQLRPLVHRVTNRARWRSTTGTCEQVAHAKTWQRSIRVS